MLGPSDPAIRPQGMLMRVYFLILAFSLSLFRAQFGFAEEQELEAGLNIDDSIGNACEQAADSPLNTCPSGAVMKDLKAHFLRGKGFSLAAVEHGLMKGSVWFKGEDERQAIYGALASFLASEELESETELVSLMQQFPSRAMRTALEYEATKEGHSEEVKARLNSVIQYLVKSSSD